MNLNQPFTSFALQSFDFAGEATAAHTLTLQGELTAGSAVAVAQGGAELAVVSYKVAAVTGTPMTLTLDTSTFIAGQELSTAFSAQRH